MLLQFALLVEQTARTKRGYISFSRSSLTTSSEISAIFDLPTLRVNSCEPSASLVMITFRPEKFFLVLLNDWFIRTALLVTHTAPPCGIIQASDNRYFLRMGNLWQTYSGYTSIDKYADIVSFIVVARVVFKDSKDFSLTLPYINRQKNIIGQKLKNKYIYIDSFRESIFGESYYTTYMYWTIGIFRRKICKCMC